MRVLVVEDDAKTASFIVKGLKGSGYSADHAEDGEQGLFMASSEHYDAVILDIMLPLLDGVSLTEELRKQHINVPVLFLSAKCSVKDRVRGLQSGGDDYLTKPFSFAELLARIQALVRRSRGISEPTCLTVGDLEMNLLTRKVKRQTIEIELQPREFALLEYLMRNAGRVVSRTMITEHVWGYSFDPMTNVVEARICKLRDKIDKGFKNKLIQTIRGFGYALRETP